jgi:hypothetical protein
VSQRRTVYADILKPRESDESTFPAQIDRIRPEPGELSAAEVRKPKTALNKATDKENYTKLTAYIPRKLHYEIKMAMAQDQETDQSSYIERWLREMLDRRKTLTESQRRGVAGS